jgi:hypothetical protein
MRGGHVASLDLHILSSQSLRLDVNDTLPVAKKLIEGTIFQPDPLEAKTRMVVAGP